MPNGPTIDAYLTIDGAEVDPAAVRLTRRPSGMVAKLAAPRDGTYRFGVSIEASEIVPLAPGMLRHTAASLPEPTVLHYPYDWTWNQVGNVLSRRPRLVMPGVMAGGRVYLVDTHELLSIRLEPTGGGKLRALLLAHRVYNDGGDIAMADLELRKGERAELRVLIFDDIEASNRARFGVCPPMEGRITQAPYRNWTASGFGPEEYAKIARRLRGVFDWVIVREAEVHDWLPPIFHEQGIQVLSYQYMGALRRHTAQITEALEAEIGMRDADGRPYRAPRSPDGAWALCDIRRPEVRDRFVENARSAIAAGFDGVFLDGYPFWADATGRIGGNVPEAEHSLAYTRWKLLTGIREAMRKVDPEARLGVLGNDYFDTLGVADFSLKERMYWAWDDFAQQFDERGTKVRQDLDLPFEDGQAPYAANSVAYGIKGYSPISVQSALHFLRRPTGLTYIETGDFFPDRLDDWLEAVARIATEDDLYITSIDPPPAWVCFRDLDTFWSDAACTIELSRAVCLASDAEKEHRHEAKGLELEGGRRYRVLRECPER